MWEQIGQGRAGYRLTIRATRVSLRQLVAIIVGCVLVGGAAATAALIAISVETDSMLGRSDVVLVAGGLAVVIALALLWIFAWRRKRYVVEWDDRGIRIIGAGAERALPWASIARVLIRLDTDYARVEVRSRDGGVCDALGRLRLPGREEGQRDRPDSRRGRRPAESPSFCGPTSPRNALGLHVFLGAQQTVP